MRVEQNLLGFTGRVALERLPAWDIARRRDYLLRNDIGTPLSVDTHVWPEAFPLQAALDKFAWRGNGLWSDLDACRRSGDACQQPYWTIAVSVLRPFAAAMDRFIIPENAIETAANWTLLGYDVADEGFISGLMNCGFSPQQAQAGTARWGSALNSYHLFDSPDQALAYGQESNARVPEHAPFYVFGLRRLA